MSSQRKILIVEDEAIVAMETRLNLVRAGYLVTGVAASGVDALRLFDANTPDLVLMDIMLRDSMTGVDVAHELRKTSGVPIIFVTGNSDERTRSMAGAVSGSAILFKPLHGADLLRAIADILK